MSHFLLFTYLNQKNSIILDASKLIFVIQKFILTVRNFFFPSFIPFLSTKLLIFLINYPSQFIILIYEVIIFLRAFPKICVINNFLKLNISLAFIHLFFPFSCFFNFFFAHVHLFFSIQLFF